MRAIMGNLDPSSLGFIDGFFQLESGPGKAL